MYGLMSCSKPVILPSYYAVFSVEMAESNYTNIFLVEY